MWTGLPARMQYPDGFQSHRRRFSWFRRVSKQILRWFPIFKLVPTSLYAALQISVHQKYSATEYLSKFRTTRLTKNSAALSYYQPNTVIAIPKFLPVFQLFNDFSNHKTYHRSYNSILLWSALCRFYPFIFL
jgi:hypothetical protein